MTEAADDGDLAVLAEVQGVLIEVLEARNSELTALLTGLEERLAKLERAASRNSGNSSMPPSADDLPGKTAPQPRKSRGGREEASGQAARRAPGLEQGPG